nr:1,6-anhydro-N-acetylmuramyl-L-alanine amidase AmpD [Magnetofaba australis]
MDFRQLLSPHCDERPPQCAVELVVVHAISLPPGAFGGPYVDQLFTGSLNPDEHPFFAEIAPLRVAAHFLVNRAGLVTQYVAVSRRAWHAGVSQWRGRQRCNDFSVGVELEGDERTPFAPIQYVRLAQLFRTLQTGLPQLRDDGLAGHEHIAPGRKWDPGPMFDWTRLQQALSCAETRNDWPILW